MNASYDTSSRHASSGEPGCADDKAPPSINGAPDAAEPSPQSPHDASARQNVQHMPRQHAAQFDLVQQRQPTDQQLLDRMNSLQPDLPAEPYEPALLRLPPEPMTAVRPSFKPGVAGAIPKNRGTGVHEERRISRGKDGSEGKDCWGFRDGLPARLLKQCRVRPHSHCCSCCHHARPCTAGTLAAVTFVSIALVVYCIFVSTAS